MGSGGALVRPNFSSRSAILAPDALAFEMLIWDPIRGEFVAIPLNVLRSGALNQRSVTATPIVIASSDQILNCKIAAPAACALPPAATRNGIPLTFKDLGQALVNHITITTNGAETIDGQANFVIQNNFQGVTLIPLNDGTNTGWSVQ